MRRPSRPLSSPTSRCTSPLASTASGTDDGEPHELGGERGGHRRGQRHAEPHQADGEAAPRRSRRPRAAGLEASARSPWREADGARPPARTRRRTSRKRRPQGARLREPSRAAIPRDRPPSARAGGLRDSCARISAPRTMTAQPPRPAPRRPGHARNRGDGARSMRRHARWARRSPTSRSRTAGGPAANVIPAAASRAISPALALSSKRVPFQPSTQLSGLPGLIFDRYPSSPPSRRTRSWRFPTSAQGVAVGGRAGPAPRLGLPKMLKLMFMPFRLVGGIVAGVRLEEAVRTDLEPDRQRARARSGVPGDRDPEADRRARARGRRLQGRPGSRRPRDARRVLPPDGPLAGREAAPSPSAAEPARLRCADRTCSPRRAGAAERPGLQAHARAASRRGSTSLPPQMDGEADAVRLPRRRRRPARAPVPARPGSAPRGRASSTRRSIAAHGSPIPFLRKGSREELRAATGQEKLPALKLPDGTVLARPRARSSPGSASSRLPPPSC